MNPINGIYGLNSVYVANASKNSNQDLASMFSSSYKLALAKVSLTNGITTSANSALMSSIGKQSLPAVDQQGSEDQFHETALKLQEYRQQLLASNIANADTPGYKAVDIDFKEAMRQARSSIQNGAVQMSLTTQGHISSQALGLSPAIPLQYHIPQQASLDGNTVEMDVERVKFTENAIRYEFSVDRVKGHYKDIADLLNNLPY